MIVVPCKMPYEYVIEMFCDFIGAGKAYEKDKWTKETPWNYWVSKCEKKRAMHKTSEYLIKKLLWNLHESKSVDDFVEQSADLGFFGIHHTSPLIRLPRADARQSAR